MIVLLSGTEFAKNMTFVGNKTDTLNVLLIILMKRNSWSDYMYQVRKIITLISFHTKEDIPPQKMSQGKYRLRICDISLPQYNTGFVCFLISIPQRTFVYIGIIIYH